eukprot:UN05869
MFYHKSGGNLANFKKKTFYEFSSKFSNIYYSKPKSDFVYVIDKFYCSSKKLSLFETPVNSLM